MICEKCTFQDPIGQFTKCPMCESDSEQLCPFLNHSKGICRLDGVTCSQVKDNSFESCSKITDVHDN